MSINKIKSKLNKIKADNLKEYTLVYKDKNDKPFAFGLCFTKLFYIFIIGSFLGTILETIWALFEDGKLEIRVGMVYGPFIPVYGFGACFLTLILYKLYKANNLIIFIISAISGAAVEYICSLLQQYLFGTVSWDYRNTPFNINGRTNLMFALIWGFLGLVWIRYLYPWFARIIEKIPKRAGAHISAIFLAFMYFNAFMSVTSVCRWNERSEGVPATSSFAKYLDENFDDEHMEFLFPNMMNVNDKHL